MTAPGFLAKLTLRGPGLVKILGAEQRRDGKMLSGLSEAVIG